MSAELLVNVTPFETRIARVENGLAEELYIERERERGLKGNIYNGRVQRVLPGIQAAFVDIGLPRAGFLYVGDVAGAEPVLNGDDRHHDDYEASEKHENGRRPAKQLPDITSLLKEGQQVTVQVSKDPISSKGPRLTSMISLAGRYLVYLPHYNQVGIAHRIEDPEERQRLLEIGQALKPESGGLIIRTVAEGHHLFDLQHDLEFLLRLWRDIEQRIRNATPGSLIHMELNLYLRVMRDFVDDEVEKIHIDSREAYDRMRSFAKRFMPDVAKRLYYYPGQRPIFDVYGIEKEINGALKRRVDLKSGGHIVIDQTEALIAIDVNSGSFIGSRNMEETGFKTNLEAVHEIVHQLRMRNLGGIIVVDFIDMQEEESRKRLIEVLEEAISRDKAKMHIVHFSELGLVEMTRKRTRDSLGRALLRECPQCHGIGYVKSLTTICYQLFREVVAESRAYPCNKLMVIAHPEIIDLLLGEESEGIANLENFLKKEITLKSDEALGPEQYEVVLL
ncbi:MAG TPA: Rne/Rng family ribonuclease [Mariprofundaceae bacterium]|nr:Rne/Rng family ribonuclease [Mariprofundaceae bacterium]